VLICIHVCFVCSCMLMCEIVSTCSGESVSFLCVCVPCVSCVDVCEIVCARAQVINDFVSACVCFEGSCVLMCARVYMCAGDEGLFERARMSGHQISTCFFYCTQGTQKVPKKTTQQE